MRVFLVHSKTEAQIFLINCFPSLEPTNNGMTTTVKERRLIPHSVSLSSVHIHKGINVFDIKLQVLIFLL